MTAVLMLTGISLSGCVDDRPGYNSGRYHDRDRDRNRGDRHDHQDRGDRDDGSQRW
jgi:hypothetical protein